MLIEDLLMSTPAIITLGNMLVCYDEDKDQFVLMVEGECTKIEHSPDLESLLDKLSAYTSMPEFA